MSITEMAAQVEAAWVCEREVAPMPALRMLAGEEYAYQLWTLGYCKGRNAGLDIAHEVIFGKQSA